MNSYVSIKTNGPDRLNIEVSRQGIGGVDIGEMAKEIRSVVENVEDHNAVQIEAREGKEHDGCYTRCDDCQDECGIWDELDTEFGGTENTPDIVNVVFDNVDDLSAHILPSRRNHPVYVLARLLFVAAERLEDWTDIPAEEEMLYKLRTYALKKMDAAEAAESIGAIETEDD